MKLSKRGQAEPATNFTVSLIIGILIIIIMAGIGINLLQKQMSTKDSFNTLIENLDNLEESDSMIFELPNNFYLVSFHGGNVDIDECADVEDINLNLPDACGILPCLCYCKNDLAGNLKDDACLLVGNNCHPFTEENVSFYYPECNSGVFINGPNSGVMNLYYKKEGGKILISTTKDYYPESLKEKSVEFESFIESIRSCEQEEDCLCELDYEFLSSTHVIDFEKEKITLRIGEEAFAVETAWNFAIKGSEPEKLTISQTKEFSGIAEPIENPEAEYVTRVFNGEEQTQIRSRLLKQGNMFYFYPGSESYENLDLCGSKKLELK